MLEAPDTTRAPARTAPPVWLVVALACAASSSSSSTSPWSTWRCRPYAAASAWTSKACNGWSTRTPSRSPASCCSAAAPATSTDASACSSSGSACSPWPRWPGGLAQEGWQLLVARAVQGLGAAVLAPSTLTLVTAAVPEGAARARAIATWTAVGAGGGAAGGFVGGVLVEALSWRWVLLINVPVGAVVLAAAARWITESRAGDGRRLDLPGAILVTAGLATLAYGVSQTEAAGWTAASTVVPLCAGLALVALFLLAEARAKAPLMPLGLLRLRSVASANVAMFLSGSAMFCMWFFMTLYAQNVLGYTTARRRTRPGAQLPRRDRRLQGGPAPDAGHGTARRGRARHARRAGRLRLAVHDDGGRRLPHRHHDPGRPDDARRGPRRHPAGLPRHVRRGSRGGRPGLRPGQHLPHDGRLARPRRDGDDRGGPHRRPRHTGGPHRGLRPGLRHGNRRPGGGRGPDVGVAAAHGSGEKG